MIARRRCPGLAGIAIACGLAAVTAPASAELAPLYLVPTDDRLQVAVGDDRPLRLEFEAVDRERLLAALGPGAVTTGPATVRFDLPHRPTRLYVERDRPSGWLESTFIVDHDQPAVIALRDEFRAARAPSPDGGHDELVRFVDRKVDAVHGQGWEPASLTARSLRGDCTEHAVLTAALARSLGIPARVLVGMVIVRPGQHYAAVGHAWAELRVGEHWTIADAALGPLAERSRYVPLGQLEDEGPGFMLPLVGTLTSWVTRVVVLGSDD